MAFTLRKKINININFINEDSLKPLVLKRISALVTKLTIVMLEIAQNFAMTMKIGLKLVNNMSKPPSFISSLNMGI